MTSAVKKQNRLGSDKLGWVWFIWMVEDLLRLHDWP